MTRFINGPAKGVNLSLSRAPFFLRVTCEALADHPKFDALDKREDTARETESIHLYALAGPAGMCFLDGRDPRTGKRWGRQEMIAGYQLYPTQPPDDVLRDNAKYQAWCLAEAERMKAAQSQEDKPT